MGAVDVGIGHDDDAVVTCLVGIEVVADIRSDSSDQGTDGVTRQGAVKACALDVQDLAAQGQDRLVLSVARLLRRAACRVALDDDHLGFCRVLAAAVRKLSGTGEGVEHALAARHLPGAARGLACLQRLGGLADDSARRGGILLQVFA